MRRSYKGKRSFTRKRRAVSWLTAGNQRQTYTLDVNGGVQRFSLGTADDNDFVENHPRFAKRNDIVPLRRIVGSLRLSMYWSGTTPPPFYQNDSVADYGLCIVKGDYSDAGVWTPPDTLPNPSEASDYDDKWLFTNRVVFSFGANYISPFAGTFGLVGATGPYGGLASFAVTDAFNDQAPTQPLLFIGQPSRPTLLSTDQQLPSGSMVDISTRRKLLYGEKLCLLTNVTYEGPDPENRVWYAEVFVKTLIAG